MIKGFQFAGISAGIKESRSLDLALIRSERPAVVVGAFTTNKVVAAPVVVSRKNTQAGRCSAIVINSGNANACTGRQGLKDAEAMTSWTARLLGIPKKEVLVCSTGKIGVPLPMKKIQRGIPKLVRSLDSNGFKKAAKAILTTDKGAKIAGDSFKVGGKKIHLIGMAKGAGMIEPHMATLLAFFMTDFRISRPRLSKIFKRCVEGTFNRISVDGDMSTNDCVLLMANGVAKNKVTPAIERRFENALFRMMKSLALEIVRDGEGATKCVKIEVKNAPTVQEAKRAAYTVANSPLVKTSFFGEDPNWGRVMGALGRSGANLTPEATDIYYDRVCLFRKGRAMGFKSERKASQVMKKQNFTVTIDCHQGRGSFGIWTSDLGLNYVKLNSDYRT